MKLKLYYFNEYYSLTRLVYDVVDVFPVGDGFVGVEMENSIENMDELANNTFHRRVLSLFGDDAYHFLLVNIDVMTSGNIRILFEKQH